MGKAGGDANFQKHGVEHMREIGRRGGRPTWQETIDKAWAEYNRTQKRARCQRKGKCLPTHPHPTEPATLLFSHF